MLTFIYKKAVQLYFSDFCAGKERKMRILIVDDEHEIRNVLRLLLTRGGYEVIEAGCGVDAVRAVSADNDIDLCIMDIMMPKLSGIDAARKIREFSTVPILFLTARSLDGDKAQAYGVGGDDYIVKPFSSRELLMKVEALTRRYNNYAAKVKSTNGIALGKDVILDIENRTVTKADAPIDIRDKEYEVLAYLAKNRGRTVNVAELYRMVWGEMPLPSSANTITVHVLNLRRKLEDDPSSPKIIRTVWGRGYQID